MKNNVGKILFNGPLNEKIENKKINVKEKFSKPLVILQRQGFILS